MGSAQMQGDLWGARARDWADLQEATMQGLYDAAFDAAGVGASTSLLDVGCGAGLALQIAQSRGAKICGIDAAANLAALARGRCPGADIRIGELEQLPFDEAAFDVTTGFNSFQYAEDPVKALTQAKRVTKPNGHVVIAVWGAPENCGLLPYIAALGKLLPPPKPGAGGPFALSPPGALEALAEKAGLKPEEVRTVTTAMQFADRSTAIRALLASGVAERAIRHSGEAAVAKGIGEAIEVARKSDGSYHFNNEWRFLVARA